MNKFQWTPSSDEDTKPKALKSTHGELESLAKRVLGYSTIGMKVTGYDCDNDMSCYGQKGHDGKITWECEGEQTPVAIEDVLICSGNRPHKTLSGIRYVKCWIVLEPFYWEEYGNQLCDYKLLEVCDSIPRAIGAATGYIIARHCDQEQAAHSWTTKGKSL